MDVEFIGDDVSGGAPRSEVRAGPAAPSVHRGSLRIPPNHRT